MTTGFSTGKYAGKRNGCWMKARMWSTKVMLVLSKHKLFEIKCLFLIMLVSIPYVSISEFIIF